jgi:ectoine hydroxylase
MRQRRGVFLTDKQMSQFESHGFLRLPGAFTLTEVERFGGEARRLLGANDAPPSEVRPGQIPAWWTLFHNFTRPPMTADGGEIRNVVARSPMFMDLVDDPRFIFPIAQILGENIALLGSHLMYRGQTHGSPNDMKGKRLGWHRDLGTSSFEMTEPHPRIAIKAALWLTGLDGPGQGAMMIVPGSHRCVGELPIDAATNQPSGAIPVLASPGDVLLWEQRLWHTATNNYTTSPRISLFYAYGYRWLRPMDYETVDTHKLAAMMPVRRQLLGAKSTEMGCHLPTPEDVPLRDAIAQARAASAK